MTRVYLDTSVYNRPLDNQTQVKIFTDSDYLLTCDRRLINRCRELVLQVINPVDFILETEDDY